MMQAWKLCLFAEDDRPILFRLRFGVFDISCFGWFYFINDFSEKFSIKGVIVEMYRSSSGERKTYSLQNCLQIWVRNRLFVSIWIGFIFEFFGNKFY